MQKILVIQTAFIGDAILTLPMLQKLKEKYPDYLIDVIAIPSTEEIFRSSPAVNEVIVLEKRGKHKSLISLFRFAKEIKERKYNKIFSPHRSFRTALIVMQSGVKETYAFDNSSFKHVYRNLIPYVAEQHEVQRNLSLIGLNSNEGWRIKPELAATENSLENIKRFLQDNKIENGFVGIAPGTVWNTKKYPAEYFTELIKYLNSKGRKILLIGGEKDKKICEDLSRQFQDEVLSAAGRFNLVESVELLKHCRLLISNDSAPVHLGMGAGIPVLALYCSTVPEFGFYPYNKKSSYLSFNDLECKPCGIHGYEKCPLGHFACGYKLLPNSVINKIEEMLNDN